MDPSERRRSARGLPARRWARRSATVGRRPPRPRPPAAAAAAPPGPEQLRRSAPPPRAPGPQSRARRVDVRVRDAARDRTTASADGRRTRGGRRLRGAPASGRDGQHADGRTGRGMAPALCTTPRDRSQGRGGGGRPAGGSRAPTVVLAVDGCRASARHRFVPTCAPRSRTLGCARSGARSRLALTHGCATNAVAVTLVARLWPSPAASPGSGSPNFESEVVARRLDGLARRVERGREPEVLA